MLGTRSDPKMGTSVRWGVGKLVNFSPDVGAKKKKCGFLVNIMNEVSTDKNCTMLVI